MTAFVQRALLQVWKRVTLQRKIQDFERSYTCLRAACAVATAKNCDAVENAMHEEPHASQRFLPEPDNCVFLFCAALALSTAEDCEDAETAMHEESHAQPSGSADTR